MKRVLSVSPRGLAAAVLVCLCLFSASCSDAGSASDKGSLGAVDVLQAVTKAKGKVVILNFWASWCQPCRLEIPELKELRGDFPEEDLYLLGVSIDRNAKQYQAFVDKAAFNYPVGLGGQDILDMFQVSQVPKLMVYDTQGRLVVNTAGVTTADGLRKVVRKLLDGAP